jgi:hypothetical protein
MPKHKYDPKTQPAMAFKYNSQAPAKYYVPKEDQYKYYNEELGVYEDKFKLRYIEDPKPGNGVIYPTERVRGYYIDLRQNMRDKDYNYKPEPILDIGRKLRVKVPYAYPGTYDYSSELLKKLEKKIVFEK